MVESLKHRHIQICCGCRRDAMHCVSTFRSCCSLFYWSLGRGTTHIISGAHFVPHQLNLPINTQTIQPSNHQTIPSLPINPQHLLQILQRINILNCFIFPPAAHAGETKGHTTFVTFAFGDAFKGNFKNQFRFYGAHGAKFF